MPDDDSAIKGSLAAAAHVLKEAGKPLHYREITRRMLDQGLWATAGKTPEATVNARLACDLKQKGQRSIFVRNAKGISGLREWSHKENLTIPSNDGLPDHQNQKEGEGKVSFTAAAEKILTEFANKQPMHYRTITEKALGLGLLATSGKTPEATMYAQIISETRRYQKRGEQPRFVIHGKGLVSLASWQQRGLPFEIEQHNRKIRQDLHKHLLAINPYDFEELIFRLLAEMGFEDIEVTKRSGDGGIDVRGTLVVGDVIRTKMAVQVKRWRNRVQAPVVQQVRGALGTHEQGLIITTSGFSHGARNEAARGDAVPVALMDGDQLLDLLVEHEIGVTRHSHHLLELSGEESS